MSEVVINIRVEIDECIAKEVENLNNLYDVQTTWSCCGHGDEKRAGIVALKQFRSVLVYELGYEVVNEDDCTFEVKPKSKCKCGGN